jgi:hypothetical protein
MDAIEIAGIIDQGGMGYTESNPTWSVGVLECWSIGVLENNKDWTLLV